jgi:adenylate cyclase
LEAWELTIKAGDLLDTGVKANVANAQQLLKRALELDSNYPAAQIELGWSYLEEFTVTWNLASEGSWQKAFDAAESAIELDPKNPGGYSLLGHLYMSRGEIDRALAMSTKSIELGPSDSYGQAFRGDVLIEAGRFDEGIAAVRNAIRLCPFPPAWFLLILGTGFHLKGENELALSALEQSIKRESGKFNSLLWLASVLIAMGREDDAKEIARSATSMEPEFSTREWASKISPKSRGLIKDNILAAGFPK